jgi:hypothetical protein
VFGTRKNFNQHRTKDEVNRKPRACLEMYFSFSVFKNLFWKMRTKKKKLVGFQMKTLFGLIPYGWLFSQLDESDIFHKT